MNEKMLIKWKKNYVNSIFFGSLALTVVIVLVLWFLFAGHPNLLPLSIGVFGAPSAIVFGFFFGYITDGYKKVLINYDENTFTNFSGKLVGTTLRNLTFRFEHICEIKDEHDRIRILFSSENQKFWDHRRYGDAIIKTSHLDHTHEEILALFNDILEMNNASKKS